MNGLTKPGDRRMTVREVADVLGVSHDKITRKVRELFPDLMQNGITTYLNEAQVTAVKMAITSQLAAIVPMQNCVGRENELTTKVVGVKTSLEKALLIRQAMQFQQEIIDNLQKENEEMKPKAAFFDQVADSGDALQMRDVAGVLNLPGWGRNTLFEFLRKKDVLDSRNIPYRKFQDQGYFRLIEQRWTDKEGETHISLKTLVYQRGVDFIRRLLGGAA